MAGEGGKKCGVDRRSVFVGLFTAATLGSSSAGSNSPKDIESAAAAVAYSMHSLHGGDWRVHIDHDVGVVTVFRDCS